IRLRRGIAKLIFFAELHQLSRKNKQSALRSEPGVTLFHQVTDSTPTRGRRYVGTRPDTTPAAMVSLYFMWVERLRQQVEEFQRTVEEELRTARALLEELH